MPSKTDSRNAQSAPADFDDLDNYFLEGDLDDDPFASPKPVDRSESGPNKRKEPGDGLGIDEEVSVAKKVRVPRIKLDQERLLSQKGIPALRKRARDLRLKGKGHEWGDASRLLSFYQEWLDDLFPKAKFLDALAMVEKAGHNKMMQKMRVEWINEGKPKDTNATTTVQDEEEDHQQQQDKELGTTRHAERVAPIFEKAAATGGDRSRTPELDDIFGDDIYNATPVGAGKRGEPDEDELDALKAEAEGSGRNEATKPKSSIFGNGKPKAMEKPQPVEPEEDDLDALLAEAEAEGPSGQKAKTSEAVGGDEDDLDALMAEAEAQPATGKPSGVNGSATKQPIGTELNDDEEAMAEMDGLW
ncbi:Chromosome segregation in meiosis protein 3 [Cytospora mali]|uniref:Chromosome segregation in meiosis protein n=1 Tax=Cytospora mali TaxID=578113 RepID=A0A194W0J5_CYTMA|nr:Chromosome segregation in meiosis protein 3 [Valsa mali]